MIGATHTHTQHTPAIVLHWLQLHGELARGLVPGQDARLWQCNPKNANYLQQVHSPWQWQPNGCNVLCLVVVQVQNGKLYARLGSFITNALDHRLEPGTDLTVGNHLDASLHNTPAITQ